MAAAAAVNSPGCIRYQREPSGEAVHGLPAIWREELRSRICLCSGFVGCFGCPNYRSSYRVGKTSHKT